MTEPLTHMIFLALLTAAAAAFALLEIQIEGPDGWALSLPTWRVENRWTRRFLGARAITGYHVCFQLLVFLLVHLPYAVQATAPSWRMEARLIAFLIAFWVLEDFLWFVFNPAFGIRTFRKDAIWWHAPNWWWIMPRDYWIFTPIAVALYCWSWRIL